MRLKPAVHRRGSVKPDIFSLLSPMFMFVPSFLFCDPSGVLGLIIFLVIFWKRWVKFHRFRFQPVPLTRPDASLGTASISSLSVANGKRRRELSSPAFPIRLSRGLPLACHTGSSMRAGQDEGESIPRARLHLFLECVWIQDVRNTREPWRRVSPLRQHTTGDRRKLRDALSIKAIVQRNRC